MNAAIAQLDNSLLGQTSDNGKPETFAAAVERFRALDKLSEGGAIRKAAGLLPKAHGAWLSTKQPGYQAQKIESDSEKDEEEKSDDEDETEFDKEIERKSSSAAESARRDEIITKVEKIKVVVDQDNWRKNGSANTLIRRQRIVRLLAKIENLLAKNTFESNDSTGGEAYQSILMALNSIEYIMKLEEIAPKNLYKMQCG